MTPNPALRTLAAIAVVAAAPAWAQFTGSTGMEAQSVADKPRCSTLLDTDPRKIARDCTPDSLPAPAVDAAARASVGANSLDPSGTFPVSPAPEANPGAGAQGSADNRGVDLNTGANVNKDTPPSTLTGSATTQQPLSPPAVPPPAR